MNGVINIYKEKGCTSFHLVYELRKLTGEQKVGHTGTLDPDVTGVLPICLGKATKLVGQLTDTDKTYKCVLQFGKTTDTQDDSGNIIDEMSPEEMVSILKGKAGDDSIDELIVSCIKSFEGDIQQVPPMYSALKVDGVKLVDAARRGQEIERKARTVTIHSITDIKVAEDMLRAEFTVDCSKGTYVRTLCEDIGKKLGIPACMLTLERTKAAGLDLSTAITLDEAKAFAAEGTLGEHVITADKFLETYDSLIVNDESVRALLYGNFLFRKNMTKESASIMRKTEDGRIFRIYDSNGIFYALYVFDGGLHCLKCVKMFRDLDE